MKKMILVMFVALLSIAVYGCGVEETNGTANAEKIDEKNTENQSETNVEKSKEETANNSKAEQNENKNEEELSQELEKLKKEKEMFLLSHELGQDLFSGMVNRDVETLKNVLGDDYKVLDGKIVKEENGRNYEVPFDILHLDKEYDLKTSQFFLHEGSLIIIYDIYPPDAAMFHLQLTFVAGEDGSIKIENFGFDA